MSASDQLALVLIAPVVPPAPLPVVMKTMCFRASVLVVVTTTPPFANVEVTNTDSAAEKILPHNPVLNVDVYEWISGGVCGGLVLVSMKADGQVAT